MSHRYYWTRFELSWLSSAVGNRCDRPTPCSFFIQTFSMKLFKHTKMHRPCYIYQNNCHKNSINTQAAKNRQSVKKEQALGPLCNMINSSSDIHIRVVLVIYCLNMSFVPNWLWVQKFVLVGIDISGLCKVEKENLSRKRLGNVYWKLTRSCL